MSKVMDTPPRFPRRPGIATQAARSAVGHKRPDLTADAPLACMAMGTVYAIANQKGGVGKTTTAVNLAACVAEAGYEALLVDIDPQSNATIGLGIGKDAPPTRLRRAGRRGVADRRCVVPTAIEHLSLVPAGPDLAGATVELPRIAGLRDAAAGGARADPRPLRVHAARLPAVARAADRQRARRRRSRDRPRAGRVLRARGPRRPARHAVAGPARAQSAADRGAGCC